jgi:hypothetical protein
MKKKLSYIYKDIKIHVILFSSRKNTPHITLGNDQCLQLLFGVCNTEERCDISISLELTNGSVGEGAGEQANMRELNSGLVLEFCQLLQHRKRFYKKRSAIYISCIKAVKTGDGDCFKVFTPERWQG